MSNEQKDGALARTMRDHISAYGKALENHGVLSVNTLQRTDLNIRTPTVSENASSQPHDFSYGPIVEEMGAFGPIEEVAIDDTHSFAIGTTVSLDPHTYVSVDGRTLVGEYRKRFTPDSVVNLPQNGLPERIQPIDETKPIRLPLHLIVWCFVKDTSQNEPIYHPFDALSAYANPLKLTEYGCSADEESLRGAVRSAYLHVNQMSMQNREVVSSVYNHEILPQLVDAILSFDSENPGVLNIGGENGNKRDEVIRTLTSHPQLQRVYTNVGHATKRAMEVYDTGRGPASLEPWHSYTRFVPIDVFVRLIGNQDAHLDSNELDTFHSLMQHIKTVMPTEYSGDSVSSIDIETLTKDEFFQYLKLLDPYSDFLATFSLPVLQPLLENFFTRHRVQADVSIHTHMAHASSLTNEHGQSLKIIVPTEAGDVGMSDIEFGVQTLDKMYPALQDFMERVTLAYQEVFALFVGRSHSTEEIHRVLIHHFGSGNDDRLEQDILKLADAVSQLKPTAKMELTKHIGEEAGEAHSEADTTQNIQVRELILILLRNITLDKDTQSAFISLMVDDMTQVGGIKQILKERGVTLTPFYSNKNNVSIHSLYDLDDSVWAKALEIIKRNCFDEDVGMNEHSDSLQTQMVMAALALDRQGIRNWPRTFNLPTIPGFVTSYRVMGEGNSRNLEMEIGISVGLRAALEMVQGVIVHRQADSAWRREQSTRASVQT